MSNRLARKARYTGRHYHQTEEHNSVNIQAGGEEVQVAAKAGGCMHQ